MIADMFIERRRRLDALGRIYDGITAWWRDAKSPYAPPSIPLADLVVIGEAVGPDTLRALAISGLTAAWARAVATSRKSFRRTRPSKRVRFAFSMGVF